MRDSSDLATQSGDDPIEELIDEFRELADEAGDRAEKRKEDVDLSEVDTSHMALAEKQGMRQAFQMAWRKAIEKREEVPADTNSKADPSGDTDD